MLRSRIYNGRSILCLDLAPIDGEGRSLSSRDHGRGFRFVASCEPVPTLPEQAIAGMPMASDPPICEPYGIWVSLDANQDG
jgi:hypothetical protein